jgi:hypothetical protein
MCVTKMMCLYRNVRHLGAQINANHGENRELSAPERRCIIFGHCIYYPLNKNTQTSMTIDTLSLTIVNTNISQSLL